MKDKHFLSSFVKFIEANDEYLILLNTLNQSIVKIKKEIWTEIEKYLNNKVLSMPKNILDIINELEKREFLLKYQINENIKKNIVEAYFYKSRTIDTSLNLWISLTSICNFDCIYWQYNQKHNQSKHNRHTP